MSQQTVESILTQAMSDPAFANSLFANPDFALSGFDLTAEEISNLKSMSRADFEQYAKATPEERKSLGWGNHNETALIA